MGEGLNLMGGLDLSTVSEAMRRYIEKKALELTDYTLEMDYDTWGYSKVPLRITRGERAIGLTECS